MSFLYHPGVSPPPPLLGGKAGTLAALHGCGFSIPPWFAILPGAPEARLAQLNPSDKPVDGAMLRQLRPGPDVAAELEDALRNLCPKGELVAVRSSAPEEDGAESSFAGMLDTFLMVPPGEVADRVAAVWRSAFGERAEAYRRQRGIPGPPRLPAVIIQRMVHADVSGVAFGADPVTGRTDIAIVSAVAGLGTALVNGEQDADTWHVDGSGRIVRRQDARPPSRVHRDDQNSGTSLDETQVLRAAELVRRTGSLLGGPQDVEWALEGGRMHLLQSRPITARRGQGDMNIWDNSNIVESYPGVTLPLTFSLARRAYAGVYRQFCVVLAVPRARIDAHDHTFRHMLGLLGGRVYYNLLNWYRVLALLPGFTLNRRFMEQMMGVKEALPDQIVAELGRAGTGDRIRDGFDALYSLGALVVNHFRLPWRIRSFQDRLNRALEDGNHGLDSLSAEALCGHFLELEKRLLTRWDAPLLNDFFAMIFHGVLRRITASWIRDPHETIHNDLLCGEGGMISAEPARRIHALARMAARQPALVSCLCDGPLDAILAAMDHAPGFKRAYHEYLGQFGDRCLGELKLESLTLNDDPLLLLRSIGTVARQCQGAEPAGTGTEETNPRHRAESRITQALRGHPARRAIFQWVLRHTRARVRDRENLRFERTRLFGRVRRIFVELGRRLHQGGHLLEPRDVFLLEIDEVLGFVDGTATTTHLKPLVAMRRAEYAAHEAAGPLPGRLTTRGIVNGHPTPVAQASAESRDNGETRRGTGCCPGLVRGRVCRVTDPRHAAIRPGEILVAERTDPGWVMLFPAAAGLLVARGSLLSHSAIVARELGLPAIVAIEGLMGWLGHGDEIEMDGTTGVVCRLRQAGCSTEERSSARMKAPGPAMTESAP